jgi:broad specificity phosphatase PhoE
MTRLLLIRHGATDAVGRELAGRRTGVALNAEGRAQADRLVERLDGVAIDLIAASPLERARDTARPLARARGLPVRDIAEINEIDYGDWQGATMSTLSQRDAYWATYNAFRSFSRVPNGELLLETQLRMVQAVERLRREGAGQCMVLVSHGDPIRALLLYLLGMPIDFISRLDVAPASISAVQIGADHVTVECINQFDHRTLPWRS